jgi:hypothetical protein
MGVFHPYGFRWKQISMNGTTMASDIRDRAHITHEDVLALNFIRSPNRFVFRRHYRQGLRSHVMEVLDPSDIQLEKAGRIQDGQRLYPRAIPVKVLRIFRTRFSTCQEAIEDIRRFQIMKSYLSSEYLAGSEEFVVEYHHDGGREIILCGLQSFVRGQILDPWCLAEGEMAQSASLIHLSRPAGEGVADWIRAVRGHAARFVALVRRMITEAQLVPDLAGVGNILLTRTGAPVLVDINNICPVSWELPLTLDEKGYPTCDKSVEALARIQTHLAGCPADPSDPLYRQVLDPQRMAVVNELHHRFQQSFSPVPPDAPPRNSATALPLKDR